MTDTDMATCVAVFREAAESMEVDPESRPSSETTGSKTSSTTQWPAGATRDVPTK